MSKRITSKEMVATKNKNNVVSCSTPEHRADSPSRDSDSICDSEAASPVPFLCTQDGAEGLTDVVWNFYTPKSGNTAKSRQNSTPVSRRAKRSLRPKLIEKQAPKRKPFKSTQKKTELFQDLIELNEHLHELIAKKTLNVAEKPQSGSEDDIFHDSPEHSPKGTVRSKNCLRKNVLSSNFTKPDPETALDSDDSMNECLIKASQVVEERMYEPTSIKRPRFDSYNKNKLIKSDYNFKMDQDSMDAILNSIKLESPIINNAKKSEPPQLNNDSFDSFVGNLNDSALDRLTQIPAKTENKQVNRSKLNSSKDGTSWTIKELVANDSPSSKSIFGRHNSMPESPSVPNNKPSTSGMVFGRYSSMPYENNDDQNTGPSDSPIRCTPDEIKKKHQLAREKLMAKRLLPFTSSQKTLPLMQSQTTQQTVPLKKDQEVLPKTVPETGHNKFQPRIASTVVRSNMNVQPCLKPVAEINLEQKSNGSDIKSIIEKKRQEALMRLRRRQVHSKMVQ